MRRRQATAVLMLGLGLSACTAAKPRDAADRVVPNDNRIAAGTLRDGVLSVRLELRQARWFPDGDKKSGEIVRVFAEEGRAPQNPGPLIRVPAGTKIQATVHNPLTDSTLVVYGLHQRPSASSDTIQVGPGATREVSFTAGEPGTYFYWGTTSHAAIDTRRSVDTQLQGAFVVDSAGSTTPQDRVFVLGSWSDPGDSAGPPPHVPRDIRTINGLSWPNTERFAHTVGDTVRWRWINPTSDAHPMHLHGFYFAVTSRGTWAADTTYLPRAAQSVVTEMPTPGGTFAMQWVPEEPGNWLMHCHITFHISPFLSFDKVSDPADPIAPPKEEHSAHGMRGMILGITVDPGRSTVRRPTQVDGARELRLIAQAAPKRYVQALDGLAYVLQSGDHEPAPDSVPVPSSPIVLHRGQPVKITVINRLRAPTAVHWHGIELPSWSDGVPAWSGASKNLAPMIAPGDSFVARFTPPRAGTFIYHSHSNELFQISLGLYGALLVVDPEQYDAERERVFVVGGNGPVGWSYGKQPEGESPARVNGKAKPDTVRMIARRAYRLRIIQINPDFSTWITLQQGSRTMTWRALAKDGAELAEAQRMMGPATILAGPGETADFEFTPSAPGQFSLEVRQRSNEWSIRVPIVVESVASRVATSSVSIVRER